MPISDHRLPPTRQRRSRLRARQMLRQTVGRSQRLYSHGDVRPHGKVMHQRRRPQRFYLLIKHPQTVRPDQRYLRRLQPVPLRDHRDRTDNSRRNVPFPQLRSSRRPGPPLRRRRLPGRRLGILSRGPRYRRVHRYEKLNARQL